MESLYIVMPAYNEQDNIRNVVEQWYPIVDRIGSNSRLVVADSGSTDDTHKVLEKLKNEKPRLEILSNTGKQHGPKVIALYKYAIGNGWNMYFKLILMGRQTRKNFMILEGENGIRWYFWI